MSIRSVLFENNQMAQSSRNCYLPFLILIAFSFSISADVVHLKNGRKLEGEIEKKGSKVHIMTAEGIKFTLDTDQVAEIQEKAVKKSLRVSDGTKVLGSTSDNVLVPRLKVVGKEILDPDGVPIRLRGFNLMDDRYPKEIDFDYLEKLDANCVRLGFHWLDSKHDNYNDSRDARSPGFLKPKKLKELDQWIEWAGERRIWVILQCYHMDYGDYKGVSNNTVFSTPRYQREFFKMWSFLADRFKDKPYIAAYEIINEPHPNSEISSMEYWLWYNNAIQAIRKSDSRIPIVVSPRSWSNPEGFDRQFRPFKGENLIYTVHFYWPHEYTISTKEKSYPSYPGAVQLGKTRVIMDRKAINLKLDLVQRFQYLYSVPIYCGEFGALYFRKGRMEWIDDVIKGIEERSWHWSIWGLKEFDWKSSRNYRPGLEVIWEDKEGEYHEFNPLFSHMKSTLEKLNRE